MNKLTIRSLVAAAVASLALVAVGPANAEDTKPATETTTTVTSTTEVTTARAQRRVLRRSARDYTSPTRVQSAIGR